MSPGLLAFSLDETKQLFQQAMNHRHFRIEDEVIEDIYQVTAG